MYVNYEHYNYCLWASKCQCFIATFKDLLKGLADSFCRNEANSHPYNYADKFTYEINSEVFKKETFQSRNLKRQCEAAFFYIQIKNCL